MLDGDPAPSKGAQQPPPSFWPMSIVTTVAHLSCCWALVLIQIWRSAFNSASSSGVFTRRCSWQHQRSCLTPEQIIPVDVISSRTGRIPSGEKKNAAINNRGRRRPFGRRSDNILRRRRSSSARPRRRRDQRLTSQPTCHVVLCHVIVVG